MNRHKPQIDYSLVLYSYCHLTGNYICKTNQALIVKYVRWKTSNGTSKIDMRNGKHQTRQRLSTVRYVIPEDRETCLVFLSLLVSLLETHRASNVAIGVPHQPERDDHPSTAIH